MVKPDPIAEPSLFDGSGDDEVPLAFRMRPRCLSDVQGQPELTAPDSWFARNIEQGRVISSIFWGPPGTGKTTLAMLMSQAAQLPFVHLSAVAAAKADVQGVVNRARSEGRPYLLFLDEIHRFNRAQQDVLLPCIEDGTLILVGATTENPSFTLNNALLSRCRVILLKALDSSALKVLLKRSVGVVGGESSRFSVDAEALDWLARSANGDARYALNAVEALWFSNPETVWTRSAVERHWSRKSARYDRHGDCHYDLISALHKSMRDSDVDAACYWLARMLEAGEEPLYLARRMIRMATEDVGLADTRALSVCLNAHHMYEILGSPEGEQGLFEAIIYLALAPKSNAAYRAETASRKLADSSRDRDVPLHLRNAPTELMKALDYGAEYQYAHDAKDAIVAQHHFPDGMQTESLYQPTDRGFERTLTERKEWLKRQKEKRRAL